MKEVCVLGRDMNGLKRGTVLAVRPAIGGIGLKESKDYIWMLREDRDAPERGDVIEWEHMLEVHPNLDPARIENPDEVYQPFLNSDPKSLRTRNPKAAKKVRFKSGKQPENSD